MPWLYCYSLAASPEAGNSPGALPTLRTPRHAVSGSVEGLVWREVVSTCCPVSAAEGDAARETTH